MPSWSLRNLAKTLVCLGLAGSSACVRAEPESPEARQVAALARELAETRRLLAARIAGLHQAEVNQAALARRIEELTALNDEMVKRLQMSAHGVELLAAERQRLVAELEAIAERTEPASAPLEAEPDPYAPASAVESSSPPAPEELAITFEP